MIMKVNIIKKIAVIFKVITVFLPQFTADKNVKITSHEIIEKVTPSTYETYDSSKWLKKGIEVTNLDSNYLIKNLESDIRNGNDDISIKLIYYTIDLTNETVEFNLQACILSNEFEKKATNLLFTNPNTTDKGKIYFVVDKRKFAIIGEEEDVSCATVKDGETPIYIVKIITKCYHYGESLHIDDMSFDRTDWAQFDYYLYPIVSEHKSLLEEIEYNSIIISLILDKHGKSVNVLDETYELGDITITKDNLVAFNQYEGTFYLRTCRLIEISVDDTIKINDESTIHESGQATEWNNQENVTNNVGSFTSANHLIVMQKNDNSYALIVICSFVLDATTPKMNQEETINQYVDKNGSNYPFYDETCGSISHIVHTILECDTVLVDEQVNYESFDFINISPLNGKLEADVKGAFPIPLVNHTITYNSNGGSDVSGEIIADGDAFTRPTNPTKIGYTFDGWFLDDETFLNEYDFTSETGTEKNIIVYAKWTEVTYDISYVLNGGMNNEGNPIIYTIKSDKITLLNPTRTGYTFVGWFLDGVKATVIEKGSTGNKIFIATWELERDYTITYIIEDDAIKPSNPISYNIETENITLLNPTRAGYTFAGWFLDGVKITVIEKGSTGNKILTATWTVITYDISYVLNGGTNNGGNPTTYTINSNKITLLNPTRAGYTFAGWFLDGVKITVIEKGSIGYKTFIATWELESDYIITYILEDDASKPSNPISYNIETENITLLNPTREGYTFAGWFSDGFKVTVIEKGSIGDKTFTATWTVVTYEVSYVLVGGTNNEGNPTAYTIKSETIILLNPTRTGYTFAGWTEGSTIMSGSTGDKTFTATWNIVTYEIRYVLNGGINNEGNPTSYDIETENITLLNPTREGYTFAGWFSDGFKVTVIEKGSIGNKIFTAAWNTITYEISYVLGEGTNNISNPTSYDIETEAITLLNPTKIGYTFAGWTEGSTIMNGSIGDKTFTATWNIVTYEISYVLNGGTNNTSNPMTYNVETENITLLNPTRAGYTFAGWFLDEVKNNIIEKGSIGSKTFIATWEIESDYTITYIIEDDSSKPNNPLLYNIETENITLLNPTRAGYTFAGWFLDGIKVTVIEKGNTGNKILTATWNIVTYEISYVLNGGTNNTSNPMTYNVETENITLLNPTRAGYTFAGWFLDEAKNNIIEKGSIGNKTFIATWEIESDYTITYIIEDDSSKPNNPLLYNIETENITLLNPTRAGYTFAGWLLDGIKVTVIEKGNTGNKILTATWNIITYEISYVLNGGTNNGENPTSYTIKSETITLLNPTRVGYIFANWTEGNTTISGSTGNKTFTATWNIITYEISYALNGGTNNKNNPTSYNVESGKIILLNPKREGYTFAGWTEGSTIANGSTGNKTFTATWTQNKKDIIEHIEELVDDVVNFIGDIVENFEYKWAWTMLGFVMGFSGMLYIGLKRRKRKGADN